MAPRSLNLLLEGEWKYAIGRTEFTQTCRGLHCKFTSDGSWHALSSEWWVEWVTPKAFKVRSRISGTEELWHRVH